MGTLPPSARADAPFSVLCTPLHNYHIGLRAGADPDHPKAEDHIPMDPGYVRMMAYSYYSGPQQRAEDLKKQVDEEIQDAYRTHDPTAPGAAPSFQQFEEAKAQASGAMTCATSDLDDFTKQQLLSRYNALLSFSPPRLPDGVRADPRKPDKPVAVNLPPLPSPTRDAYKKGEGSAELSFGNPLNACQKDLLDRTRERQSGPCPPAQGAPQPPGVDPIQDVSAFGIRRRHRHHAALARGAQQHRRQADHARARLLDRPAGVAPQHGERQLELLEAR